MAQTDGSLSSLTVLDCSTRLSGAFCGRLFGDYGAAVTLVEPQEGHALRHEPPFYSGDGGRQESLLHIYVNANKRSVVLDWRDGGWFSEWLSGVDVLIADDPELIDRSRQAYPQLIIVALTAHGLTGPLAGTPGNDLTAFARSSWALTNGDPDMPPLKGSLHQAGYVAGLCAFVAALAAVRERQQSALGQTIDASELEALTLIAGPAILVAEHGGMSNDRHAPDMVRGPVECKDGWFSLTISRAQFWRDAMNVLGLHDLAEDKRYAAGGFRRKMRAEYSGRVEARIREWPKWELFEALGAVRCVAGVVLDSKEIVENPHLAGRQFFVEAPLAGGRTVPFPGAPFKTTGPGWSLRRSAPVLGSADRPGGESALTTETRNFELAKRDQHISNSERTAAHGQGSPAAFGSQAAPLAGVRAIVLTQAWAGTFSTELLGLLGAEVIQVEARRRPDSWRGDYQAPIPAAIADPARRQRPWNCNGLYNAVNLNKRGITLDLQHPRGIDLYRRLVPHADIVAENFSPRVMGNLGLDYAGLCRIKRDIILASLSAYGATGPYWNVPGIGGTIEPMSGMSSLLGYEGGRPQNSGSMYPDPVAGMYGAAAMIMALLHRDRTGEGQYIDLGMMEANATFIGDALLEYVVGGGVRPRMGNRHPRIAPHNAYQAAGGAWVVISADTDEAWRALATYTGHPEWLTDRRFATMEGRKAHEAELDTALAAWCASLQPAAIVEPLAAKGVCAAPVWDTTTVRDDPHLRTRGFFVAVNHPEAGANLQAGIPWQLSRTPAAVNRPAPMMGEHSRAVLAEFLGVSDAEYEELVALGVTGDEPPE